MNILSSKVTTLAGETQSLEAYQGKVLLIVNVASQCGFTPQYQGLEKLHQTYQSKGLAVLGFPCNQFGGQEPGSEKEIREFCDLKFKVTFPMFSKVEVNGPHAHPLFKQLTSAKKGLLGLISGGKIQWNFTKFLVDRQGHVVKRYGSVIRPEAIARDIEKFL